MTWPEIIDVPDVYKQKPGTVKNERKTVLFNNKSVYLEDLVVFPTETRLQRRLLTVPRPSADFTVHIGDGQYFIISRYVTVQADKSVNVIQRPDIVYNV